MMVEGVEIKVSDVALSTVGLCFAYTAQSGWTSSLCVRLKSAPPAPRLAAS